MAMSTQTSNNKSSIHLNYYNAAVKNDTMILNELKDKNSIFFGLPEKDGNVHVVVPHITDAASNKKISMAQGVYIAQGFKTMGVTTHRAITANGAKSLGTFIRPKQPHVEITNSYKIDDKEKNSLVKQNEELKKEQNPENDFKIKANEQAINSGYRNVAFIYYPVWAVNNTKALKNAFRNPNTPDIDMKKWEAFMAEMKAEKEGKKPELPVINGNSAKDWKEHIKNCMTGNEVVLSKEKASEFATAMINDIENAQKQGNPFLFQQTVKKANIENLQEAKERNSRMQEQLLGIETKAQEVTPQSYDEGEEISF